MATLVTLFYPMGSAADLTILASIHLLIDLIQVFGDLSELEELNEAFTNLTYYYPNFSLQKFKP